MSMNLERLPLQHAMYANQTMSISCEIWAPVSGESEGTMEEPRIFPPFILTVARVQNHTHTPHSKTLDRVC